MMRNRLSRELRRSRYIKKRTDESFRSAEQRCAPRFFARGCIQLKNSLRGYPLDSGDPQDVVCGLVEDYPRDLLEFEARFATEEACRGLSGSALRWRDGFRCPNCGLERAWPVRKVWFECAACGRQNVRHGRYDLSGHTQAVAALVPSNVARRLAEETESAPWVCNAFWDWAATKPPGLGCTSCGGRWCGRGASV